MHASPTPLSLNARQRTTDGRAGRYCSLELCSVQPAHSARPTGPQALSGKLDACSLTGFHGNGGSNLATASAVKRNGQAHLQPAGGLCSPRSFLRSQSAFCRPPLCVLPPGSVLPARTHCLRPGTQRGCAAERLCAHLGSERRRNQHASQRLREGRRRQKRGPGSGENPAPHLPSGSGFF